MKKYTEKQHKAIASMVCMMDELDNKPRRLFQAMREFTEAFCKPRDEKNYVLMEEYNAILNSIDVWERDFYQRGEYAFFAGTILNEKHKTLKEIAEKKRHSTGERYDVYEIDAALTSFAAKILKNLADI